MAALSNFSALTELRLLDQVSKQDVSSSNTIQYVPDTYLKAMLFLQGIERIEGLHGCPHLKKLWLIENRISVIENLQPCTALQELYLTSNRISDISGINNLTSLQVGMGQTCMA
jgi:Leucine-rich repeat (LRR) protein